MKADSIEARNCQHGCNCQFGGFPNEGKCESPLDVLSRERREGPAGALAMALRHGLLCVGCCWALMALLFVAGVMNLVWVAAIAGFVLVEKLMRHGAAAGRVAGVVFFVWSAYVLVRAA